MNEHDPSGWSPEKRQAIAEKAKATRAARAEARHRSSTDGRSSEQPSAGIPLKAEPKRYVVSKEAKARYEATRKAKLAALRRPSAESKAAANNPAPAPTGGLTVDMGKKFIDTLFRPARHKALFGGRGSGKSWSVATYLVIQAAQRKLKIVCARQFQNSIRDSSKELIEKRIHDLGLSSQYISIERAIVHKGTGSVFLFVGLERNVESIRSLEGADVVWVEEARMISEKSKEILIPTVRKLGSELIWTWNPELPTDPIDAFFRGPNPPEDSIITRVGVTDNPFFKLTEMPAEMEALRRGNYERYLHVWEGEYDQGYESRVFPRVTIGRPHNLSGAVGPFYGLDFGFTDDPVAIVKVFHLPATNELYIAAEIVAHGVSLEQLPSVLRSILRDPGDLVKADGASPIVIDFLQSKGFAVHAAKKGQGSVRAGVIRLQGFSLLIDPDCEHTRNEVRAYSWQTERLTGKVISGANPIGADHAIDAIRYCTEDLLPTDPKSSEDHVIDDGGVFMISLWNRPGRGDQPFHLR